jgi:hypothetical protein
MALILATTAARQPKPKTVKKNKYPRIGHPGLRREFIGLYRLFQGFIWLFLL